MFDSSRSRRRNPQGHLRQAANIPIFSPARSSACADRYPVARLERSPIASALIPTSPPKSARAPFASAITLPRRRRPRAATGTPPPDWNEAYLASMPRVARSPRHVHQQLSPLSRSQQDGTSRGRLCSAEWNEAAPPERDVKYHDHARFFLTAITTIWPPGVRKKTARSFRPDGWNEVTIWPVTRSPAFAWRLANTATAILTTPQWPKQGLSGGFRRFEVLRRRPCLEKRRSASELSIWFSATGWNDTLATVRPNLKQRLSTIMACGYRIRGTCHRRAAEIAGLSKRSWWYLWLMPQDTCNAAAIQRHDQLRRVRFMLRRAY